MANPFLFGDPASGHEAPNPFLMNQPAAAAVNPFMANDPQSQQMGYYHHQQQQPQAEAGNPFASFGASAYGGGGFGHPNAWHQQPTVSNHYNHQQQYQGQFGHYTQVMADSASQPQETSSLPAASVAPSSVSHGNPFGAMMDEEPQVVPAPKVEARKVEHGEEEQLPPPPLEESVAQPVSPEKELANEVPVVEEPLPPPPTALEEEEIFVAPAVEESLEKATLNDEEAGEPPEEPGKAEASLLTEDAAEKDVEVLPAAADFDAVAANDEEATVEEHVMEKKKAAVIGGMGAALFGTSELPMKGVVVQSPPSLEQERSNKMSTGDAIFSDIPSVPDYKSTGASLFGGSEESAQDTTGAKLFDVAAPREAKPALGAMSGWDAVFDQKFDTVAGSLATKPGDPFDPFGGPKGVLMTGRAAFGIEEDGFGNDDFSSQTAPKVTPLIARRNPDENPFLAMEDGDEQNTEDGPLFDDDTSLPLEAFPRVNDVAEGWEMFIRHPPKKKLTANRFWKKIFVKLVMQGDTPAIQLFDTKESKDAFQELPLQPAYSLSDISHQVFDQYSKIFTLKLQYIFYKERAGIRPGQVSKMQKLTGKLSFLAKAVEDADYEGVKEFASDMKKLGVPLEHAPQVSELLKLGSTSFDDLKNFSVAVEEKLFKMDALRDRSLTYKTEEIQLNAVDEVFVEQTKSGHVVKQLCRVRVFFLSFLSGMPDIELGVNDITRMGLEVVGRHDILPVPTEQWIRYEDIEFHSIVDRKEFEKNDHIIKFRPPDACYLEIMRFRVRPPKARELPMQARCMFIITGQKVEIRADMLIPYPHTKAWGQVPCEDVAMRIPLPECWIYQFRTEKAHISLSQLATGNIQLGSRMGSVKSAHRRAGKVKGIERFLGTVESQASELMECSSGQAKYEHQHRAIVWRVPRLPKHGQGSYTNHEFVCKLQLTSFDQMPENFEKNFYVEFTQPATTVSNTVLRSVSVLGGSGDPPEKFVKYLARHEYKLEIEFKEKEQNTYAVAAKLPIKEPTPTQSPEGDPDFPEERPADSSDSDD